MRTVTLGSVCEVTTGQSAPQEAGAFGTAGTPFVRAGSLERLCNGESEDSLELVPPEQAKKFRLKIFPANTVVFAKSGMSAKVGRVYRLRCACHVVSHLAAVLPSSEVDSSYLHRWFEHRPPSRLIENDAYPSIKTSTLQEIVLSLPSLPEQRRIAVILDKADALRAKRREAIAKLDQLLQSVFAAETASQISHVSTIGELLDKKILVLHKDGNHGSQYPRKEEFREHGVPFLSARNLLDEGSIDLDDVQFLVESKANSLKIGWIEAGDVLLAHNASVGKVALYRGEFDRALIGTSLTTFRPDPERLRPEFLFMTMRSDEFQRELTKDMSQTTRNQVPITAQRRLNIRVPAAHVQDKIVRAVNVIKTQKDTLCAQVAGLEHLFTSLQQRAFAGTL